MKAIVFLLLAFALPVIAQVPDSSSALFNLRDAEQNFARASLMFGRNAAFVANFAEESVIFTDKWITNGRQFTIERKSSPIVLKWEPEFMDISASGDFGVSTGPWEVQEYRPNTQPLSTGYFLTVWKKHPDGVWKVALDAGSVTPVQVKTHLFSFPAGADKAGKSSEFIKSSPANDLPETENQMLSDWSRNPVPATYISFLSKNVRMQYEGHLPSADRDTIIKFISESAHALSWKTSGSGMACSGDLGFTYGYLFSNGAQDKPLGHYVRIWKKEPGGKWLISIEMLSHD